MSHDFIDFLKQNFDNPDAVDLDAIRRIISETNKYLLSLRNRLESNNPNEKEEALSSALEIQKFLEAKVGQFAPFMGIELTEEEQAMIAEIQQGVDQSRDKGKNLLKPKI